MRIAQISPLIESVPPRLYGGTERIVSYLTEELVRLGHDVTLFASRDSVTAANLVPCAPMALRLSDHNVDPIPHYMVMLDRLRLMADQFDILHFHIDGLHFPLFARSHHATATTLHGRQDLPDLPFLYRYFPQMPLVAISHAQRLPIPSAHCASVIHHGLPLDLYRANTGETQNYLAFLGRISPEKRPDRAIQIARRAGIPLKIAAKVDTADSQYFEACIKPLLSDGDVEFIGEINEHQKEEFLGNARALLFPIDWPEPFGLVMIEAMACGTPVLAFNCGSVPEVIDDGISGRIVNTMEEADIALPQVLALDRATVRRQFEQRFSVTRMAEDYLALYRSLRINVPAIGTSPETVREILPARTSLGGLHVS
ncbi:glycosyltransferase family 4 protein [Pseudochelatococcus sp. G4_1912]|uniref:glycosyltransferase family 4 protein n=1 Tax=Pseudochelatococcus sp. G4_1912 TaxID=3114288 RepID=UPI0039C624D9